MFSKIYQYESENLLETINANAISLDKMYIRFVVLSRPLGGAIKRPNTVKLPIAMLICKREKELTKPVCPHGI